MAVKIGDFLKNLFTPQKLNTGNKTLDPAGDKGIGIKPPKTSVPKTTNTGTGTGVGLLDPGKTFTKLKEKAQGAIDSFDGKKIADNLTGQIRNASKVNSTEEKSSTWSKIQDMLKGKIAEETPSPVKEQEAETVDARHAANMEDLASRRSAYLAARNTGANRAMASAIAGSQGQPNQTSAISAMKNMATGSQADYLNKMGYANALDMQAENKDKAAWLNTLGGILKGAGTGAGIGMSLGGGTNG